VAVPVPGVAPAAAISVSGPEGRLVMDAVPRVASLLQSAAAALAAELAAGGDLPALVRPG
jgi:IclR family acetate operon transcriptional repressor